MLRGAKWCDQSRTAHARDGDDITRSGFTTVSGWLESLIVPTTRTHFSVSSSHGDGVGLLENQPSQPDRFHGRTTASDNAIKTAPISNSNRTETRHVSVCRAEYLIIAKWLPNGWIMSIAERREIVVTVALYGTANFITRWPSFRLCCWILYRRIMPRLFNLYLVT